jgi:hypothetical protein
MTNVEDVPGIPIEDPGIPVEDVAGFAELFEGEHQSILHVRGLLEKNPDWSAEAGLDEYAKRDAELPLKIADGLRDGSLRCRLHFDSLDVEVGCEIVTPEGEDVAWTELQVELSLFADELLELVASSILEGGIHVSKIRGPKEGE